MSEVIMAIVALSGISAALMKWQQSMLDKNEKLRARAEEERTNILIKVADDTKEELKKCQMERREERKEYLESLDGNTKQLKNVAEKLDVIPTLKLEVDNIKTDIKYIKQKLE